MGWMKIIMGQNQNMQRHKINIYADKEKAVILQRESLSSNVLSADTTKGNLEIYFCGFDYAVCKYIYDDDASEWECELYGDLDEATDRVFGIEDDGGNAYIVTRFGQIISKFNEGYELVGFDKCKKSTKVAKKMTLEDCYE